MLLKQCSKIACIAILLILPKMLFSADYYWVGNTGNWDDLFHWSNTSGGAGAAYATLPTSSDNVIFDLNSFTLASQSVTINVNVECANLDFTGVLNNPALVGSATYIVQVYGDLIFDSGLTHSFLGDYHFLSNSLHTITSAGKSFNRDILFNQNLGEWNLIDALNVNGEIGLQKGVFNSMNQAITAGSINANIGTQLRTFNFESSTINIQDEGLALDLRGNTTNLSVLNSGAIINFTNSDDIVVQVGSIEKTIPSLRFINCLSSIYIQTGVVEDNTNRITFGDLELLMDGVELIIDNNNDDSNIKTFGAISLPNNCRYIIGSGDGTAGYGGSNHTVFSGDFIVGDAGEGDIHGRYAEFGSNFIAGSDADCRFRRDIQFMGDLTIGVPIERILF